LIRISKFISLCGVTSRRGAEILIKNASVTVNDNVPDKLGMIIDPEVDVVKVDGTIIKPVETKLYILLNKPKKAMTTLHDPFKRRTIAHFIKNLKHRVYPVGRLDYDTEGVLLLTNDGELAYRLAHPRYGVKKIYEAVVAGEFKREQSMQISRGVKLEDGKIGRAKVDILGYRKNATAIRLTLVEGRKREVRQLCKGVGHPVKSLKRVEFGDISAKGVKPGSWRKLTEGELNHLREIVGLEID
jgi:pseudouridine synthase